MLSNVIKFKLRKVKSLTGAAENHYVFCDCVSHCGWPSIGVFKSPEAASVPIFKLNTFVMKLTCISKYTPLTKI